MAICRKDPGRREGGTSAYRTVSPRSRLRLARWARLVWAGLLAGIFATGLSLAESSGDLERVRQELERTDQVIRRAADSRSQCVSQRAKLLLLKSTDMQRVAWGLFDRIGPTDPAGPVERILALTKQARELAVDAVEACQVEFQAHESLRAMLDSMSDLLREANAAVATSNQPEARRLLEAGIAQLDRAREAYRAGEYRRAITLGSAARALMQRAMQRTGPVAGAAEASRVELALDRAEILLADVRLVPGSDTDARVRVLLDRSAKELDRGRRFLEKGRLAVAWRRAAAAREAALDALWLLHQTPEPGLVRTGLDLVEEEYREVESEVNASGSAEARRYLDKARTQLDAASGSLQSGDTAAAAQAVRTADALLRRAAEKTGR